MNLPRKIRRVITIATDSRWWGFYVQRRFTSPETRLRLASFVARRRPQSLSPSTESAILTSKLQAEGFVSLGKILTQEQCSELVDYFKSKRVFDPYRPEQPDFLPDGAERNIEAHVAHHRPNDVVQAPYLLSLANDPTLLAAAANYLGCKPTIGYLAAWWSYHTPNGAQHAEFFHRDVDDWKFLKLFVYLSDVNEKNGPHVYVKNSSYSPGLNDIKRLDDDVVVKTFGANNVLKLTGTAGDSFMEDTYGIHKGTPVEEGKRLIFQVVYSMSPLPYGPKQPCAEYREIQNQLLDPWINRAYIK